MDLICRRNYSWQWNKKAGKLQALISAAVWGVLPFAWLYTPIRGWPFGIIRVLAYLPVR
jgi:hypothetical protein